MTALLTANDIIALIDEKISELGAAAFAHEGKAHLYTSVRNSIKEEILGRQLSNQERAIRRAKLGNAILIDDTAIGAYLDKFEGIGVYKYFANRKDLFTKQRDLEADKVWAYTSRKFIEALWGRVTTSVCGARRDRIFYQVEIPAMVDMVDALVSSDRIETVNEVPLEAVRKLYKNDSHEAAYRVICLGQLRQTLHQAHRAGLADTMSDFLDEREIYRLDRAELLARLSSRMPAIYIGTPAARLAEKSARLQRFVADRLADSLPTTPAFDPTDKAPARGLHL